MARSDSAAGRVVTFGTGKLTTEADADSTKVQTVYGVLDPTEDGSSSLGATGPFEAVSNDRDLLVVRTVSASPVLAADGRYYYAMTGAAIDWAVKKGWYMDLPISGQRVVYPVQNLLGDYVLVQTMVPAAAAAECSVSYGSGVNYILMANTGMPSTDPIYDVNNDGKIDASDQDTNGDGKVDGSDAAYGGYKTNADGRDEVIVTDSSGGGASDPNKSCLAGFVLTWVGDTGSTGQWLCLKKPSGGVGGSKVIIDRVWRQIVNPPMPSS
jgi:type IV pilus assembly protein PilY1